MDNNATLAREMGLKPHQYQLIHDFVFSYPKVRYAWVFGSRATGSFRDNSDIDILIEGDTLTLNDVAIIQDQLEQSTLPYTVDIVIKNQVQSSELIKRIKEEAKQVK
ncbi:nucleotidyltransferase family protein [Salinivibrio sp. YCSC6]|uniref:nucleotidyltransferase family protein n=1 Tax=Salinivibrio sp. YCSC6 TaxID=2003370 RepID=UPI001F0A1518|nr:nucleotidyltransferase domain-containing protein [Salinivibrio sp. YCSC6]